MDRIESQRIRKGMSDGTSWTERILGAASCASLVAALIVSAVPADAGCESQSGLSGGDPLIDAIAPKPANAEVKVKLRKATPRIDHPKAVDAWIGSLVIAAPAEDVWAVLADVTRWPAFLPTLDQVEVEPVDGESLRVRHHAKKLGVGVQYTSMVRMDPQRRRIEQALDPNAANDVAQADVSWQLIPINRNRATMLVLRASIDTVAPIPRFIQNHLVKREVAKNVEAVASEVDRRIAGGLLASAH